jgi:regulator of replication initiation timing
MWGKESIKRKSVLQYTKDGVFVKEYEYLAQVFEDGFHIGNVCQAANGKLKSSGGFIWNFKTY